MKTAAPLVNFAFLLLMAGCGPSPSDYAASNKPPETAHYGGVPRYSNYQNSNTGITSSLNGATRPPSSVFGRPETATYSSQSSSTPANHRRSFYSTDYRLENTLGGNPRVSDRFGNSTTFDRTLGGNLRSTSNTGLTTTYSQTLGGGYRANNSNGTTYEREQNLGGGYRVTGSDGSRYQRNQMLGGGYRYDPY